MRGVYKISKCIEKYYKLLNNNQLTDAKTLLDEIIERINNNNEFIEIEDIEELLDEEVSYNKRIVIKKSIMEYICDFYESVSKKDSEKIKHSYQAILKSLNKDNIYVSVDEFIKKLNYDLKKNEINNKYKNKISKSKKEKIVIIDDVNNEDFDILLRLFEESGNIRFQFLREKDKNIFVIREKIELKEKINGLETYNEATKLFNNKKFAKALELFELLLQKENQKANIYGKIGLCYLKLRDKRNAIVYLKASTILNETNNPKYDFSDLIYALENNQNEKRPKVKQEEFESDNNTYGIECINDIIEMVKEGYTLIEACGAYNLSNEQTCFAFLIYAKEYYRLQDYRNGDLCLKKVEQNDSKTPKIIKELNNIKRSKQFYKNRKSNILIKIKTT